jgi:hypothetical protein
VSAVGGVQASACAGGGREAGQPPLGPGDGSTRTLSQPTPPPANASLAQALPNRHRPWPWQGERGREGAAGRATASGQAAPASAHGRCPAPIAAVAAPGGMAAAPESDRPRRLSPGGHRRREESPPQPAVLRSCKLRASRHAALPPCRAVRPLSPSRSGRAPALRPRLRAAAPFPRSRRHSPLALNWRWVELLAASLATVPARSRTLHRALAPPLAPSIPLPREANSIAHACALSRACGAARGPRWSRRGLP